jgi:AcrR family transcriptional regulator
MDSIAQASKVNKGAIYLEFKNKEEIFLSVHRFHVNNILRSMNEAIQSTSNPSEQLTRYISTRFDLTEKYLRDRPVGAEIFTEARTLPEYRIIHEEFENGENELLRSIFIAGINSEVFRRVDIDAVIWVLRQIFKGLTTSLLYGDMIKLPNEHIEEVHRIIIGWVRFRHMV